ncbi:hypothetical protein QFA96_08100 [Pseudomonas sp. Ap32]|nr:hypothetical protein QFA96_08100 [Pseudomonas sp. Ap32]
MLDYRGGTFYTAEFVKASESDNDKDVNTSMVRWESSYMAESFFSYTGYIFQAYGEKEPKFVSFDPSLKEILWEGAFAREVSTQYEAGPLTIANFRNYRVVFGSICSRPAFKKLSKPLRVQLRDAQGNLHLVQIDYLAPDTIGDRNVLVHSVPARPTASDGSIIRLSNHEQGASA